MKLPYQIAFQDRKRFLRIKIYHTGGGAIHFVCKCEVLELAAFYRCANPDLFSDDDGHGMIHCQAFH